VVIADQLLEGVTGHDSEVELAVEGDVRQVAEDPLDVRSPPSLLQQCVPEASSGSGAPAIRREPTATIMWGALIELGIDPYDVVLWNAVPWHPFNPERGLLSNRTPAQPEMDAGLELLQSFLDLFPEAQPVAVGRKCEESLNRLGIEYVQVRHPANGGAPKFRKQLKELMHQQ
jgi:hypothetical protein